MPLLSCEQCRRRKTKCDKGTPCSACRSANLHCNTVQRDRLPRGRSGKVRRGGSKDTVLEERVERIEKLLRTAVPNVDDLSIRPGSSDAVADAPRLAPSPSNRPVGVNGDYVAPDFWTALSIEVAGIRETIEGPDLEEVTDHQSFAPSADAPSTAIIPSHHWMWSSSPTKHASDQSLPCPTEQLREYLLDVYQVRVDSVLKVGHWPTIRSGLQSQYEVHGARTVKHSRKALELAIYFTALCGMTDDECRDVFHAGRDILTAEYRSATEQVLLGSRLLQKPELDDLRALVIYLQGIRILGAYASSWTLLSVAVRVANALGLGNEPVSNMPQFERECRRRLWYSICLADTQATLDRGSTPLIPAEAVGIPPMNINEDHMSVRSMPNASTGGWTDMGCFIMTAEAMLCQKRICAIESWDGSSWSGWSKKLALVEELQQSFDAKYMSGIAEAATSLQLLTKLSAHSIAATMHLLLRRPPYRQQSHLVPPWDNYDVLQGATTVLEQNLAKGMDSRLSPWMWKKWPPWYALAVALAELCRVPEGAVADRAYVAAVEMYRRYAAPVTDPESGMLWRPITKLLRKVAHLRMSSSHSSTTAVNTGTTEATGSTLSGETQSGTRSELKDSLGADIKNATPPKPELPDAFMFDELDMQWLDDLPELDPQTGVSWLSWDLLLQDAGDPSPFT